jgi:hypothetical protein
MAARIAPLAVISLPALGPVISGTPQVKHDVVHAALLNERDSVTLTRARPRPGCPLVEEPDRTGRAQHAAMARKDRPPAEARRAPAPGLLPPLDTAKFNGRLKTASTPEETVPRGHVVVTAILLAHWRECILGGGSIDDRVLLLRLHFDVDDGAGDMGHSRPSPGRHTWSAATLASAAIDAAFAARLLEGAREQRSRPAIPLTRPRPSIYVALH